MKKSKIEIFMPGRIGPVVFYSRYGKKYGRVYQPDVKQTEATVKAAKLFGRAVEYAKHLRHGINCIMHDPKDRNIMYKLNGAVHRWLRSGPDLSVSQNGVQRLHGLDINHFKRIKVPIEVDWSVEGIVSVKFAACNALEAATKKVGATHLVWKVAIVGVKTAERPRRVYGSNISFTTPYADEELPERTISFNYSLQPGTLNIIALAVHYCFDEEGTRQKLKSWEPAGLIGTYYKAE